MGCTLILAHCQSTVVHFIALIAAERGAPSGRFFLVSHLAGVFVLLGVARFIDRYGKRLFLWISYPVLAIGLLCIPSMISSPLFFVSAILFGVGVGLLFPTVNAMAAEQGRQMDKPVVMSIFTATYDLGFVSGAIVSGWLGRFTGLAAAFWLGAGLCILAFFLTMGLSSREAGKKGAR